ncbi:MAG: hypothetical protein R3338_10960 [Thermoanaerobaculia bacterium]|nr:hypothetical protein [Thermoanaerobaculia bacterium]
MKRTLLIVALLLASQAALGWGEVGHLMINEAASIEAGPLLPPFFRDAHDRLIYLGPEPDRWYTGRFETLTAENFPEHFLNYEYVDHLELPADRYEFLDLLDQTNTLERFGIGSTRTGFSPWRIAELTERLTVQWRLWRDAKPGPEREQIEENIIHLSGVLGHYVGDTSNPLHTTIHYNGWAWAENPAGFRTDCETHARFESRFVTRTIETADVLENMPSFRRRTGFFDTAIVHIREAHGLVVPLYEIDRDGGFDGEGNEESRKFAARRLGAGAAMLRDLWISAYLASEERLATWRTE